MNQLEIEKQKLKWKWYNFAGIFALQTLIGIFGTLIFEKFAKKLGAPSNEETIGALIATLILSNIINSLIIWDGYNSWEKLSEKLVSQKEIETKQFIQNQIEELEKELLETKTELLLTQNKLREERETKKNGEKF